MNSKALFFIFLLFITMLLASLATVYAWSRCGSYYLAGASYPYYLSRISYPDWSEGVTSVFTTENKWVCFGALNPTLWGYEEIGVEWYDPHNTTVLPGDPNKNHTHLIHYHYSQGFLVCAEFYFYIFNEERELGQYRVDVYGKNAGPWEHLFTDYFQICANPCFEVNVNEHVFNVTVLSNSTITGFNFSEMKKNISFDVTGSAGTSGFCNVTIPEGLLWGEFSVYKDGFPLEKDVDYTQTYNDTHYIFYINYTHTTHTIEVKSTEVIPEFPTWASTLLLLIVLTIALAIYERRILKTPIH